MDTSNNNLETSLMTVRSAYRIGESITASLHFKNRGIVDLRVYLVNNGIFRCGQSDLVLSSKETMVPAALFSPDPHPHGYVVTGEDFHLIKPGQEFVCEQALYIDPGVIREPGQYTLEWTYRNDIDVWPGSIQTFDGPTNELFGGEKIPGIWIGQLTHGIMVDIQQRSDQ
jgi:hypothetical protein